jgi:NAD(P)-dependent dehydrogenase (short-subunit alcohol dehydrogenase family)
MSIFRLDHKKAVVTGAGSGIGRAVALSLAAQGAEVYVLDLNAENAQTVVEEILASGGLAYPVICNVSRQQEVLTAFQEIRSVNILVNSAGVSHIGTVEQTTEGDFDRLYAINVKGVYNCLYAAIPIMKAAGGGVIVNLSSIAALTALSDRFAYTMSKGAVAAMTMSIAKDYLLSNIRCNSVSPARVHTPFVDAYLAREYPGSEQEMFDKLSKSQPIGRMGTPVEIANLILFLCTDEASFITGNDYPIDGGTLKLNI